MASDPSQPPESDRSMTVTRRRFLLGQVDPASVNHPIYFMTDDDVSRGLNQDNWVGIAYDSVSQPNHVETVVARLDDGKVWKYSHSFDNPQYWSSPGNAGDKGVQDVTQAQRGRSPDPDTGPALVPFEMTVKARQKPDEFEMYNVTDDPMELQNLYGDAAFSSKQSVLAQLLHEQCAQKRLIPCSGNVPGEPMCGQQACSK